MPFYIRKAITLGPLRFNLSKSGIGASIGIKGLRLGSGANGNYVHVGRGGLYYRASLPGDTIPTANLFKAKRRSSDVIVRPPLRTIDSTDTSLLVDESSRELIAELDQRRGRRRYLPIIAPVALGAAVLSVQLPTLISALVALAAIAAFVMAKWLDDSNRTSILIYDMEEEAFGRCKAFVDAFEKLMAATRVWHVSSMKQLPDVGPEEILTDSALQRDPIQLTIGNGPPCLTSNVPVPRIPVGSQTLYFFPDRMLVEAGEGFGAVSYSDLTIGVSTVKVLETGPVPIDADIAAHIWQHATKSGDPDARYKSNRRLPIVCYELIHFASPSGLNELIQVSRRGLGGEFGNALKNLSVQ